MLGNHYSNIFVGKNYISLMVAINKVRDSKVLVIDDPTVILGRGWYQYIGASEKSLLELIGKNNKIAPLESIDQYLTEINTIIYLGDKIIELGSSAAENIRELLRKVPSLFGPEMLEMLQTIDAESFNKHCKELFDRLAIDVYDSNLSLSDCFAKLTSDHYLKGLFANGINSFKSSKQNAKAKQFHFVLQVLFQTLFSNSRSALETTYLLTSILSPRYRVNEQKIVEDLVFEFRKLGGDLKKSRIQDWEIYKGKLSYILLESFEGMIGLDNLYFFGKLPESVPFKNKYTETIFNSIELKLDVSSEGLKNFMNKRVVFSWMNHLGSDSPHWEAYIDESGITGVYSYANYEGSKPEFYYNEAMEVFYMSIGYILPDLTKEQFQFNCSLASGRDIWMESRRASGTKTGIKSFGAGKLYGLGDGNIIKSLEYWGPLKAKSLGLFSYLIDLKSNELT